ncbi:MAG: hypothetical protein HY767_03455, partial [Candidatus Omnitrophica bacterium]|nr:hypothetical protein [Candidatus Omnitrophota bacterium]
YSMQLTEGDYTFTVAGYTDSAFSDGLIDLMLSVSYELDDAAGLDQGITTTRKAMASFGVNNVANAFVDWKSNVISYSEQLDISTYNDGTVSRSGSYVIDEEHWVVSGEEAMLTKELIGSSVSYSSIDGDTTEIWSYSTLAFDVVDSITLQETQDDDSVFVTTYDVVNNAKGQANGWMQTIDLTRNSTRTVTFTDATRSEVKDIQDTYYRVVSGRGRSEDHTIIYDAAEFRDLSYAQVTSAMLVSKYYTEYVYDTTGKLTTQNTYTAAGSLTKPTAVTALASQNIYVGAKFREILDYTSNYSYANNQQITDSVAFQFYTNPATGAVVRASSVTSKSWKLSKVETRDPKAGSLLLSITQMNGDGKTIDYVDYYDSTGAKVRGDNYIYAAVSGRSLTEDDILSIVQYDYGEDTSYYTIIGVQFTKSWSPALLATSTASAAEQAAMNAALAGDTFFAARLAAASDVSATAPVLSVQFSYTVSGTQYITSKEYFYYSGTALTRSDVYALEAVGGVGTLVKTQEKFYHSDTALYGESAINYINYYENVGGGTRAITSRTYYTYDTSAAYTGANRLASTATYAVYNGADTYVKQQQFYNTSTSYTSAYCTAYQSCYQDATAYGHVLVMTHNYEAVLSGD